MIEIETEWKGGREKGWHAANRSDSNPGRLRQGFQPLYMGRTLYQVSYTSAANGDIFVPKVLSVSFLSRQFIIDI